MFSVGINIQDFYEQNINLPALTGKSQKLALKVTLLTKNNISPNSFSIIPYYVLITEQSMNMYYLICSYNPGTQFYT